MNRIERLIKNYEDFAGLPWQSHLSGAEKVWCAIYDPMDERRLRRHIGEFENATRRAGHAWALCDLTDAFAEWMASHDYRDEYFASPDDLALSMADFGEYAASVVTRALTGADVDERTVVAVLGAASLFGFMRVSQLLDDVSAHIRGRLLIMFPGVYRDNTFRLLDARDGWNYHAVPINA